MEKNPIRSPRGPLGSVAAGAWGARQLEDIPEFLLNVRGGRPLPEPVVKEIAHRYSLIGGDRRCCGSPPCRRSAGEIDCPSRLRGHAELEAVYS